MPELPDHQISSRRRYDHFGTSPGFPFWGAGQGPVFRGWYSIRTWSDEVRFELRAARAVGGTLIVASLLAGCAPQPASLDVIRARNELRVVTLNTPTCFYFGAQGTEGFEYKLARQFAADLGVRLVMYPVATERAMQAELASGRADIAAAQLTPTRDWSRLAAPRLRMDIFPSSLSTGRTAPVRGAPCSSNQQSSPSAPAVLRNEFSRD